MCVMHHTSLQSQLPCMATDTTVIGNAMIGLTPWACCIVRATWTARAPHLLIHQGLGLFDDLLSLGPVHLAAGRQLRHLAWNVQRPHHARCNHTFRISLQQAQGWEGALLAGSSSRSLLPGGFGWPCRHWQGIVAAVMGSLGVRRQGLR